MTHAHTDMRARARTHTVVCGMINFDLKVQTLSVMDFSSVIFFFLLLSCVFQKCVAYTGNNMRKQTPAPDKKEKDVSSFKSFFVHTVPVFV